MISTFLLGGGGVNTYFTQPPVGPGLNKVFILNMNYHNVGVAEAL